MRDDNAHLLSEGADREIERVFVLIHLGKGDQFVTTVVKVEWKEAFELLCDPDFRGFIGLPEENRFVFGSRRSRDGLGHANPSRCQSRFALECKGFVTDHMHLRSRYFRMTFATNLGSMQLTYETKKLICTLMGHKMGVHEEYYNIAQPLRMAAYMGYACFASADNRIKDMQSKKIEDQVGMAVLPTDPADTTNIAL